MKQLNKQEFDSLVKSLKRRGKKLSKDFNVLVMNSIKLFYAADGYAGNIQCINDVLDVARVTKGIRFNGVVEYLRQVVPHEFDTKAKTFGKKLSDTTINEEQAELFMEKFPEWFEFTREVAVKDFSIEKFLERVERDMDRAIKENKLGHTGLEMIKDRLTSWIAEHLLEDGGEGFLQRSGGIEESQSEEENSHSDATSTEDEVQSVAA